MVIKDKALSYDILPYSFITPDLNKKHTYIKIVEQHKSKIRGADIDEKIVSLGAQGVPYWVLFSVYNSTNEDKWVLSFGQKLDGRIGTIENLFLYENEGKKRFIDTITVANNKNNFSAFTGDALKVEIEPQKELLFVMKIIPQKGSPFTFSPKFVSEKIYIENQQNLFSMKKLYNSFLLISISFFLALFFIKKSGVSFLLSCAYVSHFFLFNIQNVSIDSAGLLVSDIVGILFCLTVFFILLTGKFFLSLDEPNLPEKRIIFILSVFLIASALFSSFFVPEAKFEKPIIQYAPTIFVFFVFSFLCFARGLASNLPVFLYGFCWFLLFLTSLISFLSSMGWMQPTSLNMNAYWYAFVLQTPFLFKILLSRYETGDAARAYNSELNKEASSKIAALRKSKEAAENTRLLKVIEHERQVMNDLREREIQQNEDMKKAVQSADEANRAKSAFLAVVSHEIRTPMTGVMGMVKLLLETQLTRQQKDYAQTIQDSGDAMMALLNDILDFEKIESGKLDLELVDFDLHRILNSVITLMSGHAEAKSIYLKLELESDVDQFFIGDPIRLRQVLLNLVGNSIKFTDSGGVTLRVQLEQTGEKERKVRFSIEDTGIGISEEAQKNLFNPFSQADSSINRKFGGTGLGLAICQRLIEAMGDRIRINSKEGMGSTFYFSINMTSGNQQDIKELEPKGLSSLKGDGRTLRILVVEDNEINQKLLKEFLERMNHNIVQVMNGEDAVDSVSREEFDVVLMDVELPGISGMGATKAIRALPEKNKAQIPVIALTGNVQEEDVRACYAANMNGHIGKPIDPDKLKEMLDKVLDGNLDNPVSLDEEDGSSTSVNEIKIDENKFSEKVEGLSLEEEGDVSKSVEIEASKENISNFEIKEEEEMINQDDKEEQEEETGLQITLLSDMPSADTGANGVPDLNEEDIEEDSFEAALNAKDGEGDVSENIFDRSVLQGVRGEINPEQFVELLESMYEKAEEIIQLIIEAIKSEDGSAIFSRSHELKGMAGNFGLTALSNKAKEIEFAAKDNQFDIIATKTEELKEVYRLSKGEIDKWLAQ
jgi:signal transduction histidine kinase/DNA-binding response OmpR family regulator/HPt (histidine-containing phosphotransfer) domain-containing protein